MFGTAASWAGYEVPSDLWTSLFRHGPQPLLPKLRTLHHEETLESMVRTPREIGQGPIYFSELLYGPELREIEIDWGGWPCDKNRPTELVRAMSDVSPLVKCLILSSSMKLDLYAREWFKPGLLSCPEIGKLRQLVKFSSSSVCVGPAALVGLASIPTLQKLWLCVNAEEYDWDALPLGRHGDFFPAIAELALDEASFEWCTAFLHIVTSPSLQRLDISNYQGEQAPSILFQALCVSLGEHPSRGAVRSLSITTGRAQDRALTEIYTSQNVAPLLTLSALRHLFVSGSFQVILEDAMLDEMARAWPNIEDLRFSWEWNCYPYIRRPDGVNYPKVTLGGLLTLAQHCPHLTSLTLAVDMHSVPDLDGQRPPVALCADHAPPLNDLDFTGSAFESADAAAVSAFFSLVFPQIRRWNAGGTEWPTMCGLYQTFVDIRWQERGHAHRGRTRPRSWRADSEEYVHETSDSDSSDGGWLQGDYAPMNGL